MNDIVRIKQVDVPKGVDYCTPSSIDDIEFPNNNAMDDHYHDVHEDFNNKIAIEKQMFYLTNEDEDDDQSVWSGLSRFQLFKSKCEKYIPICMPDAKVLKISKAQHRKTGVTYAVVDIRVLDVGAFSAPINLKVIRDPVHNMDTIIQNTIKHFVAAVQKKRQIMVQNAIKIVQYAQSMEGPSDTESIFQRALNLFNKKN